MHTLLLDPEEGGMVEQGSDGGHGEDSTVRVSIIVLTVVTAAAIIAVILMFIASGSYIYHYWLI